MENSRMSSATASLLRPSSDSHKKMDLHILIIPNALWRSDLRFAYNSTCIDSVSAGFIRIHPNATLNTVREEITKQLEIKGLPNSYVFLRCIGKCLTSVSKKQEELLKVKIFLPPLVYILDAAAVCHPSDVPFLPPIRSGRAVRGHPKRFSYGHTPSHDYPGYLTSHPYQTFHHGPLRYPPIHPPPHEFHPPPHEFHPPPHEFHPTPHEFHPNLHDCAQSTGSSMERHFSNPSVNGLPPTHPEIETFKATKRRGTIAIAQETKNQDEWHGANKRRGTIQIDHEMERLLYQNLAALAETQFQETKLTAAVPESAKREKKPHHDLSAIAKTTESAGTIAALPEREKQPHHDLSAIAETTESAGTIAALPERKKLRSLDTPASTEQNLTTGAETTTKESSDIPEKGKLQHSRISLLRKEVHTKRLTETKGGTAPLGPINKQNGKPLKAKPKGKAQKKKQGEEGKKPGNSSNSDGKKGLNPEGGEGAEKQAICKDSKSTLAKIASSSFGTPKSKSEESMMITKSTRSGEAPKRYSMDATSSLLPKAPVGDSGLIFRNSLLEIKEEHKGPRARNQGVAEGSGEESSHSDKNNVDESRDALRGLQERRASTQLWVQSQQQQEEETEGEEGEKEEGEKKEGEREEEDKIARGEEHKQGTEEHIVGEDTDAELRGEGAQNGLPPGQTDSNAEEVSVAPPRSVAPPGGLVGVAPPTRSVAPLGGLVSVAPPSDGSVGPISPLTKAPLKWIPGMGEEPSTAEVNELLSTLRKLKLECKGLAANKQKAGTDLRAVHNSLKAQRENVDRLWRKRYYQEQKKGANIEQLMRKAKGNSEKIKHLLDKRRSRIRSSLLLRGLGTQMKPSEKANIINLCQRLHQSLKTSKTKLEEMKTKCNNERKALASVLTEVKVLRSNLLQKKMSLTKTDNHPNPLNSRITSTNPTASK